MGMGSFFSSLSLLAEVVRIEGWSGWICASAPFPARLEGFALAWRPTAPLIWKEGKADGAVARLSTVGWVALRRFCPTLRVEAPTAVLGSWVVTSGANLVDERIGRQPTFARRAERRARTA
jgi:hypothetical protein